MEAQHKIFFISLGCAKNLVDSEHMLGLLISEGYELAMDVDEAGIAVAATEIIVGCFKTSDGTTRPAGCDGEISNISRDNYQSWTTWEFQ